MLKLSASLVNQPIMSLRTGGKVATTKGTILNPNNLKLEGLYCQDTHSHDILVLLYQDIRDIVPQGFVINDHGVLAEPTELVRLKDVLELEFELLGMPVVTVNKKKLGKVIDYATETTTMFVQKLYVSQPLYKSLGGGQLSIERTQIVEITNRKIVVQDPLQPVKARAAQAAMPAN